MCTGITFLMDDFKLQGIHIHTPDKPTAAVTFRRLMPDEAQVWIYVPCRDGIKTLGVRKGYYSHDGYHEYILVSDLPTAAQFRIN